MISNPYTAQLASELSELNPYLVLLFGSYAYGTPNEDSDLDILVVTNDDFTPANFSAMNELYLKVSRKIRPINQQIAIDLIVHTKPMYEQFIALNSLFAQEITKKGVVLYERFDKTVA